MTSKLKLRIHIAPVGFEIDRIVIPAKKMRADKVWLIAHSNLSEDKARPFLDKIKKNWLDLFSTGFTEPWSKSFTIRHDFLAFCAYSF